MNSLRISISLFAASLIGGSSFGISCWDIVRDYVDTDVDFVSSMYGEPDDVLARLAFADMLDERAGLVPDDSGNSMRRAQAAAIRVANEMDADPFIVPEKRTGIGRFWRRVVGPPGDPRERHLSNLRWDAGWKDLEVIRLAPIRVEPVWSRGVPLSVVIRHPALSFLLASPGGQWGSDFQQIFEAFPYATDVRVENDARLSILSFPEAYLKAVLTGYPGPLAHFRWFVRTGLSSQAVSLPLIELLGRIDEVMQSGEPKRLRPGVFEAICSVIRSAAVKWGAGSGSHWAALARFVDGRATPEDLSLLVRRRTSHFEWRELAARSLAKQISSRSEGEIQDVLTHLLEGGDTLGYHDRWHFRWAQLLLFRHLLSREGMLRADASARKILSGVIDQLREALW